MTGGGGKKGGVEGAGGIGGLSAVGAAIFSTASFLLIYCIFSCNNHCN